MDTYILVDKKPVREPDILKWGVWFETADRQIALNSIGEAKVSTVFFRGCLSAGARTSLTL